ncbi:MAG: hypothetical protein FRX48_07605 [Lasallia pustulata]|uniref:CCHC-type domain-containing protein n=1 Tax=Lasallia pustulata TaxID=136370 RepID=A0A5M8PHK4_9LECA|nr:MAG: hypothetical protein FRX48_07605 [Lasallia pustulata]
MSANPFVNGTRTFVQGSGVLVCIRCSEEGHTSRNCTNYALSREEQNILKTLILGDRDAPPRFPPAAAATGNPPVRAPLPALPPAVGVHSITYGTVGMSLASGDVRSTEVFLGERSGPNKRAHIDESVSTPIPAPSRPPAGAQTVPPMASAPECPPAMISSPGTPGYGSGGTT